jgi:hypothetical protein
MSKLGIDPLPPDRACGLSFSFLNRRLASSVGLGRFFTLCRSSLPLTLTVTLTLTITLATLTSNLARVRPCGLACIASVFAATEGIFIIGCLHFHDEDVLCSYAEGIPHYVVYHAGTRVLFLYPEVMSALLLLLLLLLLH